MSYSLKKKVGTALLRDRARVRVTKSIRVIFMVNIMIRITVG